MTIADTPQCIWQSHHTARLPRHRCCECGTFIEAGMKYRRSAGVWGGEFEVFHQCMTCANLCDMAARYYDEPIVFGELLEIVDEMVEHLGLME